MGEIAKACVENAGKTSSNTVNSVSSLFFILDNHPFFFDVLIIHYIHHKRHIVFSYLHLTQNDRQAKQYIPGKDNGVAAYRHVVAEPLELAAQAEQGLADPEKDLNAPPIPI